MDIARVVLASKLAYQTIKGENKQRSKVHTKRDQMGLTGDELCGSSCPFAIPYRSYTDWVFSGLKYSMALTMSRLNQS
jgi:hypothetical protein